MNPGSSKSVRYLLDEMCEKFGLCSALRDEETFQALVAAGPARFAQEVFEVEGLDPASNLPLAQAVEAHVTLAFERWQERNDAV